MSRSLVADEPIASLDVDEAQIVNLFRHLQKEHGFSFLFIAHDLDGQFLCDQSRCDVPWKTGGDRPGASRVCVRCIRSSALIAAIPIRIREGKKRELRIFPIEFPGREHCGKWKKIILC